MSSMMKQLLGGMKWTGSATAINTSVQLFQWAVIARLLDPSEIGIMSMVAVIITFAQLFTDMGVGNAIIHKQNATQNQLSTLYWLNVMTGFTVAAIVFFSAPLIADFYNEPLLVELVHLVALIFCIIPFGQQFQYIMQKNLEFDRIAKTDIISVITGAVVAILLAYLGFGVFSLVYGQIVFHSLKSLLYGIQGWKDFRPSFYFKLREVKSFLGFGLYQMGSRSVSYLSSNVDYILIGRFLGAEALGVYQIAYQLVVVPVTKINPLITKVAFPLFAREQKNNESLSKGFTDMSKMLAVITFPILFGMMSTADVLVPVMFGDQYDASIVLVQILALLGTFRVLMNPNGSILLAKGRADIGFKWDLGVAAIHTLAFYLVVENGVEAVAWTYVILGVINFLLGRILLHHVIGLNAKQYFTGLSAPAIISATMAALVYGSYLLATQWWDSASVLLLAVLVLLGIGLYAILFISFDKHYLKELAGFLKRKKKLA
ncbi:MOP flippase family protein [Rossellomorea vietnamensis]|uniref:MOP flippase family protein n=2 Tax=Rossellomorea vietnamensis TaxID=218284 RepID=A0A5D4NG84_9BACI|nr:MOP flippase family protein [Rossellomorea vietnamensis]